MKIICTMPIHQRIPITLETIKRLRQQTIPLHDIILVGDSLIERHLARTTGCTFVQHPNEPLSNKYQAGLDAAREMNPDAVLIGNSDHWISDNFCELCTPYLAEWDTVGRNVWHTMLIEEDGIQLIVRGYKDNRVTEPILPTRILSARCLDKIDWKLFPPGLPYGCGVESHRILTKCHIKTGILNDVGVRSLEVKATWKTLNSWQLLLKVSTLQHLPDIRNVDGWLERWFSGSLEAIDRVRDVLWPGA